MSADASTDNTPSTNTENAEDRTRNIRFRPSITIAVLSSAGMAAGVVLMMAGLSEDPRNLVIAGIGLVIAACGSSQFGWVSIIHGTLHHRGPFNGDEIHASEVQRLYLGGRRQRGLKYWYPVIDTLDGRSVRIDAIRTLRRKKAESQIETIRSTFSAVPDSDASDPFGGSQFAHAVVLPSTVEAEDWGAEISLTPGYDAYLREKAALEGTRAANPAPAVAAVAPELAPTPTPIERAAPQPVAAIAAPAPFVFEPQPMTAPTPQISQPTQHALTPRRRTTSPTPAQAPDAVQRQPMPVAPQSPQSPPSITSLFGSAPPAEPSTQITSLFGSAPAEPTPTTSPSQFAA